MSELHDAKIIAYIGRVAAALLALGRTPAWNEGTDYASQVDIKVKFYYEDDLIPIVVRNDSEGTICVDIGDGL